MHTANEAGTWRERSLDWQGLEKVMGPELLRRRTREVAAAVDYGSLSDDSRGALELAERYTAGEPPPEW